MNRPLKILVVEDNEINQEVIQGILERLGMRVALANDGFEAIEALQQSGFEAVFMDIQMPRMDGFEAARQIRQNPAWQTLPIIAMTAGAMNYERDILANGMNDYIAKPFNTDELLETLWRWVSLPAGNTPVEQENRALVNPTDGEPCIDRVAALECNGGDYEAYERAVQLFQTNQSYVIEAISLALDAGETQIAKNLTDTLQHLAAQIGALPLARVVEEIGGALQEEDGHHRVDQLLAQAELQLQSTIAALSNC